MQDPTRRHPDTMKENANPVVYAVQRSSPQDLEDLVGTPSIERLCFHPGKKEDEAQFLFSTYRTSEERSAHLALQSCAITVAARIPSSGGQSSKAYDPLGLLRKAGIDLDTTISPLIQQPQFHPFNSSSTKPTISKVGSKKRDLFTPDEVFQIIRNIQDPEHPLTLEQLHVVNRNHIQVMEATDVHVSHSAASDETTTPHFTFVHVHFT